MSVVSFGSTNGNNAQEGETVHCAMTHIETTVKVDFVYLALDFSLHLDDARIDIFCEIEIDGDLHESDDVVKFR